MSVRCPCGGGLAYTRDEMIGFEVAKHPIFSRRVALRIWEELLEDGDFYCPHEDMVLLPDMLERGT